MDFAATVNQFLVQHHIVALGVIYVMLRKLVRPGLVDIREGVVWLVAFLFAVGAQFGITPEKVAAFKPEADKLLPQVPADADPGMLGKIFGITNADPPH